jgi:hypothetical protein
MPISIRRTDPAIAAQATADLHGLPTGRLTTRGDAAHIFTADLADLLAWRAALGGTVTRQRAGGDITLWTLHTHTEPRSDDTHTTVLVHALTLTHEPTDPHLADAVA